MKKSLILVLVGLMILASMTGCGLTAPTTVATTAATTAAPAATTAKAAETTAATTAADPQVTLVYAEVNPLDTIVGKTDMKFKEEVEARSGGSIKIDIQASGVLGAENDVLDTMMGGGDTIDMSRISAFALTSYGGQKSKLLSIPYTFVNREHFWKFATSDLAPEFLMEPFENGSGVRGLFYGEEGFRHFFSSKDINSIEDLKGMKIRVSNDPVMQGMVEGLGASPTVVSFGELYSALQTGVVDAAEQPIANYKANAFQEVAPTMILDGHTLGAIQVIITDAAWNKLTPNQQNVIMEAGKIASAYNRQISEEAENKVLDELKTQGIKFVEVSDKKAWQDACKDVIAKASADNAALYNEILAMQ